MQESFKFLHLPIRNIKCFYFATTAESTESTETESTVSTTTVSESLADAEVLVELPQEANEVATIAANTKTNFFILILF